MSVGLVSSETHLLGCVTFSLSVAYVCVQISSYLKDADMLD